MRRQTLAIVLKVSVVFSIGMSEFWKKTKSPVVTSEAKLNFIYIICVHGEYLFDFMQEVFQNASSSCNVSPFTISQNKECSFSVYSPYFERRARFMAVTCL